MTATGGDTSGVRTSGSASAARTVAAVAALNVLSFVDRQLLVALAPLLIADLGLSRADIGLLLGVSFMLVYAVGTLAAGIWADRGHRPRILASGLAAWSAATGLTATASGFASLAVWRSLVGVGEATLPPTALSMIGDSVPRHRLGLANGVFYAGVPVGFALSFLLSGLLGPRLGWRACFLALGAAGLAGSLLVVRLADPPRRRAREAAVLPRASLRGLLAAVRERPMILALTAAGVLLVYTSAASQHAITWLVAERGFAYQRAALLSGFVTLAAGLAGNIAIGGVTDRASRRHPALRLVALAAVSAVGLLAAAAFYSLPPSSWVFYAGWAGAQAYLLGWYGSLVAAVDERAPDGARATLIGFLLLFVNLVGVGSGPFVTGWIADRSSLTRALLWSLLPGVLGALLLGVAGFAEQRAGPPRRLASPVLRSGQSVQGG